MNLFDYHESEIILLSRKEHRHDGPEIWYSGYHPETKEKYVVFVKNGIYDNGLNMNAICCRISIENPRYVQYDEILTKDEKEWFISQMTPENWIKIKDWTNYNIDKFEGYYDETVDDTYYEGVKKFTPSDMIPDYSLLPTID